MLTIYTSSVCGNQANCSYPYQVNIKTLDDLQNALSHDYVCAEYKNNHRNNDNFISSNCLPFDCDNDHTNIEAEWVTPESIKAAFPNVAFCVHYSRNHMKSKGSKSARPRFHVLFPIEPVDDVSKYVALKKCLIAEFPYVDDRALDAARFFFGTDEPVCEIVTGELTLTDYFDNIEFDRDMESSAERNKIEEGSRNSTMSRFASRVIKRFGDTDKAYDAFLEHAELCTPPLPAEELESIWKSAQRFYTNKVKSAPGYISPEEYNELGRYKPDYYTDMGQAMVLVENISETLVFTDATGFMHFDGKSWIESQQISVGAVMDFLKLQLKDAETLLERCRQALLDGGIAEGMISCGGKTLERCITNKTVLAFNQFVSAQRYYAFVLKRCDYKYIKSALDAVKPMLYKHITDFDADGFLLNTPVGTYDLRYGTDGLRDHTSSDLLTKMCSVSPDANNAGIWSDALNAFFEGDAELIEYVQMSVGLAAIGHVYQEALIIAYGEGSNGKSTFWNVISQVLGSYAGTLSADALTVGCTRNVKPEKAELKGKRLVISAELEEGTRLSTSMLKQLCSTDEITAEKKYKDPFSFTPTHTLVLYTNHLPRVGSSDDGTWRRLIVIPFKAKIKGSSDIKNYADYLYKNCSGAILGWIIEGAWKAIERDFILEKPQAVCDAISHYRENSDWLSSFFEECCEIGDDFTQKSGEFYTEYRAYCGRCGEFTRSTTDFYTALKNAGYERKRTSSGSVIYGIRLKQEFGL